MIEDKVEHLGFLNSQGLQLPPKNHVSLFAESSS